MERSEVARRVIDVVGRELGDGKKSIDEQTSFVNDLDVDSLDSRELVLELEDEFGIGITDAEAAKLQTVGQTIDYVFGLIKVRNK